MELRRADLHTHTCCSDGNLTPTELVRKARRHGIQALAVTDHDCVDGVAEAIEAGRRVGVDVMTGVELSVTVGFQEVHLLGYAFDLHNAPLRAHLLRFREVRYDRVVKIVAQLVEAGVPITVADVERIAAGGILGRPHVAAALVAAGHVASPQDAFQQYLRDGGPAWVAKPSFPADKALALLHDAGGIGVLAHPGHWMRDAVITELVRCGMDGIEVVHPSHDPMLRQYYKGLAADYGLLQTGGSDYHGTRPQDDDNFGRYTVSYTQFEYLQRRAA